ncbi:MAG: hypothetical protein AAFR56_21805, partial [Chloroflexota bacterium]
LPDETRRLLTHMWDERDDVRESAIARLTEENRIEAIPQLVAWMDLNTVIWEEHLGMGYTDDETIGIISQHVLTRLGSCEDIAAYMLARITATPGKQHHRETALLARCDPIPDMQPLIINYQHTVITNTSYGRFLSKYILKRDPDAKLVNDDLLTRIRQQLSLPTRLNRDALQILLDADNPEDIPLLVNHYRMMRPVSKFDKYTINYLNHVKSLIAQYGTADDLKQAQQISPAFALRIVGAALQWMLGAIIAVIILALVILAIPFGIIGVVCYGLFVWLRNLFTRNR